MDCTAHLHLSPQRQTSLSITPRDIYDSYWHKWICSSSDIFYLRPSPLPYLGLHSAQGHLDLGVRFIALADRLEED